MRSAPMAIARSLSILGHPLVVIPAAVAVLVLHGGSSSAALIVSVVCAISGAVLAYSIWQVHRGHWQHVDASARTERHSLSLFLAIVLFVSAAVAFYQLSEPRLALGLLLSGLMIAVMMLISPWIKLSLHASFAVFAALLLWPLKFWYVAIASVAAAGICWSRLLLARHTVAEVCGGALLGGVCGACFWLVLPSYGG